MEKTVGYVEDLTVTYGNGRTALRSVSTVFRRGLTIILGGTGSGKTTLIRSLLGLIPWVYSARVKGHISVLGLNPLREEDVALMPVMVGYAPQNPSYTFTQLQVWDELESRQLFLEEHGVKIRIDSRDALYMLGLEKLRELYVDELSGGEQRRLTIARAIIGPPRLVVLDEPLADLDESIIREFNGIVGELLRYSSIIVADHRVNYLLSLEGDVMVLAKGLLAWRGRTSEEIAGELLSKLRIGFGREHCT